ncbi:hypothetical protein GOBAR_AA16789 [Gossypium barbadense]|uniref:Uncharacterized protein n=1 Tax=Gossypium barbadense TaxID=3634 RepID=A0A2P5XKL1_GOSBA|nr:hypothetical protein GOBAR_AA16789 [Gossypium barbadense]
MKEVLSANNSTPVLPELTQSVGPRWCCVAAPPVAAVAKSRCSVSVFISCRRVSCLSEGCKAHELLEWGLGRTKRDNIGRRWGGGRSSGKRSRSAGAASGGAWWVVK